MVLYRERLPILLTLGMISVGGVLMYKFLKKRKKRYILWTEVPVHVCCTKEDWMKKENHFLDAISKTEVIGLDCEWVNEAGKRLPVSLLQIATSSDICIILRMTSLMQEAALPTSLASLLEDSSVLKVGVEIAEDIRKLHKDYGISVKGFCDLRFIADNIPGLPDMGTKSLKEMAKNVVGIEISKSNRLRCSNWEAKILSEEQICYAAGDAIIAARIFDALISRNCTSSSLNTEGYLFVTKFINTPYSVTGRINSPNRDIAHFKPTMKKKPEKLYGSVLQRPLYDNCLLVAPDGEQLSTCNLHKVQWYVDKNLGEIICENPVTVRLKFEPAERPTLDKEYYIYEKDNCCVACGSTRYMVKKFVVPAEYRRFFPEMMVSHLSHDILLLCVFCHRQSNIHDFTLRKQLAKQCSAPLMSSTNAKTKEHPELKKVRSAARAIFRDKEKRIPSDRLEVLEKFIKDFYNVTELTTDLLSVASNILTSSINEEYVTHGERVVDYMCHHNGLLAFESMWRQHFLDTMKPKYLPKMWSVNHGHEWFAVKVIEGNVDFDPNILGLSEEQLETAVLNRHLINGTRSTPVSV